MGVRLSINSTYPVLSASEWDLKKRENTPFVGGKSLLKQFISMPSDRVNKGEIARGLTRPLLHF